MSKLAQNCGFWPPEADSTDNACNDVFELQARDFGSRPRLFNLQADRRLHPLRVHRPAAAEEHVWPTLARIQAYRVNSHPTVRPAVDRQMEHTDLRQIIYR